MFNYRCSKMLWGSMALKPRNKSCSSGLSSSMRITPRPCMMERKWSSKHFKNSFWYVLIFWSFQVWLDWVCWRRCHRRFRTSGSYFKQERKSGWCPWRKEDEILVMKIVCFILSDDYIPIVNLYNFRNGHYYHGYF